MRGASHRLLLIAAALGLISVFGGAAVLRAGTGFEDFGEAVWWAFLRLSDPGYLGDDVGALNRTVSTVITVAGYVVFLGALVAVMTQWLEERMERLESGLTPVARDDHVLVLGWTHRTETVDYVGVDLSPEMLARARARFAERDPTPTFLRMDASNLEFEDDDFDTVVSSLSTCTVPDAGGVLREMGRVCRPDGRILLLEHGRSSVAWLARFQDWSAEAHYEKHGCRWAQDPLEVVGEAGLPVRRHRTSLLGILTSIEARPG